MRASTCILPGDIYPMPCFDPLTVAEQLLDQPVMSVEPVRGGRNADVWKVRSAAGDFALKHYRQADGDGRRRAECAALDFMADNGMENVPRVHAQGTEPDVVLLTWIDGSPVHPIESRHMADCVDFVGELRRISRGRAAVGLPLAKEACLSGGEIVRQIKDRLQRMEKIGEFGDDISAFLADELRPCVAEVRAPAEMWQKDLAVEYRTLSPSDFGCHNAVVRPDGHLGFVDFEYFGWDDPVKLVADFVLHPGMSLSEDLIREFIGRASPLFADDPSFTDRYRAFLPLYCLRWSLIVLNPLIAPSTAKEPSRNERDKIVQECLMKSRRFLREFASRSC